uniref:Uncharacterized protein LOC104239309 n=1 Tax=Nicotiana sylvestris TaxID=4096 RepID=A0A1U7XRF7_NICSY|nr:PREDICTED: uncharacterized protein LOC104239309 [Nicotiana sylvestris]
MKRYEFFFPSLVTRLFRSTRVPKNPNVDGKVKKEAKFPTDKVTIGKDTVVPGAAHSNDSEASEEGDEEQEEVGSSSPPREQVVAVEGQFAVRWSTWMTALELSSSSVCVHFIDCGMSLFCCEHLIHEGEETLRAMRKLKSALESIRSVEGQSEVITVEKDKENQAAKSPLGARPRIDRALKAEHWVKFAAADGLTETNNSGLIRAEERIAVFGEILEVWVWERFLQLRPPLPQLPANVHIPDLPLACRWVLRRRLAREYHGHHNLPFCRDVLDFLEDAQFIWTSYSEELIGTLPTYCTHGRHIWRASVPLTCLDIVEHHASERVFRQFGFPQPIPTRPAWDPLHYERDDRMRVDDIFIDWLAAQLGIWDSRGDLTPGPQQYFPIEVYMAWYRTVSRLFIGNPVHQVYGRYVSYAGRHEALAIGLHTVYRMGQQMQSYVHDPVIMQDYSHRFMDVAQGGGRRAVAAPRRPAGAGRCGRGRRGGSQQGGFEALADDVAADMGGGMHETDMLSYSLGIYDTPGTSQVTPSGQFLIMGSDFQGVELGRYFPGLSTIDESRPIRDFDSGRRLSYGSSSYAQASCDAATDDYIQDPDTIMAIHQIHKLVRWVACTTCSYSTNSGVQR